MLIVTNSSLQGMQMAIPQHEVTPTKGEIWQTKVLVFKSHEVHKSETLLEKQLESNKLQHRIAILRDRDRNSTLSLLSLFTFKYC